MHSGKLIFSHRRVEHETPTRMFNGIQIFNLETLMKVSHLDEGSWPFTEKPPPTRPRSEMSTRLDS
jgi:hypothetical protein